MIQIIDQGRREYLLPVSVPNGRTKSSRWKERSAPARRFAPEDFLISRAAGPHRLASPGRWKVRVGTQLRRSRVLALLFWRGIAVPLLPRRDIHDGFGVIGRPSCTRNESISRNPSGVPVLDGCTAHGAFKAADLALLYNVLAAVVNRAAFTSAMIGLWHAPNMRFGLSVFELTILP